MNFILFESDNGKESFAWENEVDNLPASTTAFTYYQQDTVDDNGMLQSYEYRIGVPVKFIIGDMYIKLDLNEVDVQKDGAYCLYFQNSERKFKPINQNTTLVNSFSDLEEAFVTVIKEQVRKK